METTTTPAATVPAKRPATQLDTVKALLTTDKFRHAVGQALPKHLTTERFLQVALTCMNKTPDLALCSQESLFAALLTLSSLGLEPDGRRAHLIPFGKTVTLIIDYKGLVELIMRAGEVAKLHADVVCENDQFEYNLGAIEFHRIDFRKPRGQPYAAYALAGLKNGAVMSAVMTRDEIEGIRKRSRTGQNGPWVTDWAEMAKKTVFRRLAKWLPLSADLRTKVEADDTDDALDTVTTTVDGPRLELPAQAGPAAGLSDLPKRGPGRPRTKPAPELHVPAHTTALLKLASDENLTIAQIADAADQFGFTPEGQVRTAFEEFNAGEVNMILGSRVEFVQAIRGSSEPTKEAGMLV